MAYVLNQFQVVPDLSGKSWNFVVYEGPRGDLGSPSTELAQVFKRHGFRHDWSCFERSGDYFNGGWFLWLSAPLGVSKDVEAARKARTVWDDLTAAGLSAKTDPTWSLIMELDRVAEAG